MRNKINLEPGMLSKDEWRLLGQLIRAEIRSNRVGRVFHFTDVSAPRAAIDKFVRLGVARQTGWSGLFKKKPKPCYILLVGL